jgi:hypothetical protein
VRQKSKTKLYGINDLRITIGGQELIPTSAGEMKIMAKNKPPAPGKQLAKITNFSSQLKLTIANIVDNNEGPPALDKLLEKIKKSINMDADQYQYILDELNRHSESLSVIAAEIGEKIFLVDAATAVLEQQIIDHLSMMISNQDHTATIKGETYSYVLVKSNPTVAIDEKSIPIEATRRIPNDKYIGDLIAKGQTIPGVKVTENFKLKKTVIKKEVRNEA